MTDQAYIQNLTEDLASRAKKATTAIDYADLAVQARNVAFLSEALMGRLATEHGCDHSRYKHTISGWGEIECEICGKSGVLRGDKPDFGG